jgi:hypothetical protein
MPEYKNKKKLHTWPNEVVGGEEKHESFLRKVTTKVNIHPRITSLV